MTNNSPQQNPINITGVIENIVFHNPENGFCVAHLKIRNHTEKITMVCSTPGLVVGEVIYADGDWHFDRQYGKQFKAHFVKACGPNTLEGMERYLSSGLIKGIGKVYAKALIGKFGTDILDIIENNHELISTVANIGVKRAAKISESWRQQKSVRDIMLFLYQHNITTARAVRIYKTYGADAIRIITENPYRMIRDIHGIGFIQADNIAQKVGFALDNPLRIRAAINYILIEYTSHGNCGCPNNILMDKARELLQAKDELINSAIEEEIAQQHIILDLVDQQPCLFPARTYWQEQHVANNLLKLARNPPSWKTINSDIAIEWVKNKLNITLAPSQAQAIKLVLQNAVSVVTGGPGVGKTTIINSIINIIKQTEINIFLCAPTGRAAKRLSESTKMPAKTIHRLLEIDPSSGSFTHDQSNRLKCDLVIVDEASMVDVSLMQALLSALPDSASLILVGDVDQLPSVGSGQVLKDIIDSGVIPVAYLREVFRQASTSHIIANAHRINQGIMPALNSWNSQSDFFFVEAEDPQKCLRHIVTLVSNAIPRRFNYNPLCDIQVLCPIHGGPIGTKVINLELQKALNPPAENRPTLNYMGWNYRVGDKVMQVQNDHEREVYNGDVGLIVSIDEEEQLISIDFDKKVLLYEMEDLDKISPAYAISIHKSQGSEYPVIVLPVMTQYYIMLSIKLIYTAVTRGKGLVVIVGQKKAIQTALNAERQQIRYTKLREWLLRGF